MQERHGAGEVGWNSDHPIRGQMAELDYLSGVVSFALCNKQLFGYYDTGVLGDGSVILCTITIACDIESATNRNLHNTAFFALLPRCRAKLAKLKTRGEAYAHGEGVARVTARSQEIVMMTCVTESPPRICLFWRGRIITISKRLAAQPKLIVTQ